MFFVKICDNFLYLRFENVKYMKQELILIDVYKRIRNRKESEFVRKTGMSKECFHLLLSKIKRRISAIHSENKMMLRGIKPSLSVENQLLLCLYYLRDYTTHLKLGEHFGVGESYSCKIYKRMQAHILSVLELPAKSDLKNMDLKQVIVDVTEQRIERPKEEQEEYYSGKQKFHTMSVLIFIGALSLNILAIHTDKGKNHDFNLFKSCYKEADIYFSKDVEIIADAGFQGILKYHQNARTPYKATKNKPLTQEQKLFNKQLAKERIPIEHINRRCKIFRIVKETYRGKKLNFDKNWQCIAKIINFSYTYS